MKQLKTINILLLFVFLLVFPGLQFSQILNVPLCEQEYDQWCWAGSSWSVLQYYGNDYQQCEIAEYTRTHATFHDFGSVDCCLPSSTPGWACNYWNYNYDYEGSIRNILIDMPTYIGNPSINNYGIERMLSESETADEIAAGRPFVIRICCGGHFVVGRGYQDVYLYYMDPWYGEGYGFGPFGSNVNGRTWTHTNVITLNPGPTCSVPQNLNAADITETSATLNWGAVALADYYEYRYKQTSSSTWTTNTTSSTSVGISGLSPGTEYEFQVKTVCASGSSNYSSSAYFTTLVNLPPVANFTASSTTISEGQSVTFTDTSTNFPTSRSWSFPGGSPSTSTSQAPTVVYNTVGVYDVTLTAANAIGEDTETKTNYITVTEVLPFVGNDTVFSTNTTAANRRAMPFTMPENGSIRSVTMYHTGGSGSMILGVYDGEGSPANRLGVTSTAAVSASTGWQTIYLQSSAYVAGGTTVWLAWVYESNPGIRYETGSPGRVDAGVGWSGGMPDPYGGGSQSNYIYSIYASYTPEGTPTQYTLTTNTVGQGSITLDPTGGTYDEGTIVTPNAVPGSGWQFDNWSGDLSGTANPTTITMNSNKTVTANFSEDVSGYCSSYGQDAGTYIDYVEFGSFSNSSGAAGYTDFTNKTVNMTSGGSCTFRIEKGDSYSSGCRVWIDFNNDGDFDDSGERVVSYGMWNYYCTGSFSVPSGLNVPTRMRVSVKRNNYPGPCEVFSYGEVEDYTVVIQ
jgi:PKD repeat protein